MRLDHLLSRESEHGPYDKTEALSFAPTVWGAGLIGKEGFLSLLSC